MKRGSLELRDAKVNKMDNDHLDVLVLKMVKTTRKRLQLVVEQSFKNDLVG